MVRKIRCFTLPIALCGMALLLPWTVSRATIPPLGTSPSAEASTANATFPDAGELLRGSRSALRSSVQTFHSVQASTGHTQHGTSSNRLSGDCALTATTLALRVTRTIHFSDGPVGKAEYIVIASAHASTTWARSTGTHDRWIQVDFAQEGGGLLAICPSISLPSPTEGYSLATLGPALVDGHATWRLHGVSHDHGGTSTLDIYIDRVSLFPVRMVSVGDSGPNHFRTVARYAELNAPVRIRAPAISMPLPHGSGGVTLTVTPNPMPANASTMLTVYASPGSRCSPRIIYATPGMSTVRPIPVVLPARVIGASGTAHWMFRPPAHISSGNAIIDCVRDRNSINQVASFFLFS